MPLLFRRVLASLLLISAPLGVGSAVPALWAQPAGVRPAPPAARGARPGALVLHAYRFKHQTASEAVALVHPMLTDFGTVELQPRGNTLVIRDTAESLASILAALREFDHPARPLRLELLIVRASRTAVSPPMQRSDLPEELTRRLRSLLPYDSYELEAQAQLSTEEGQSAVFEMGGDFQVSFRLGTLAPDGRVKLSGFQVTRKGAAARKAAPNLIHTNLNLWLDKTVSLGLAKSESSREALMLVLTLRRDEARRAARR